MVAAYEGASSRVRRSEEMRASWSASAYTRAGAIAVPMGGFFAGVRQFCFLYCCEDEIMKTEGCLSTCILIAVVLGAAVGSVAGQEDAADIGSRPWSRASTWPGGFGGSKRP